MSTKWQYAYTDDWVAVYKNGKILWQHHSPEWQLVFRWLGVDLEDLGEFTSEELSEYGWQFPETIQEVEFIRKVQEDKERLLEQKQAELKRLQEEIEELQRS